MARRWTVITAAAGAGAIGYAVRRRRSTERPHQPPPSAFTAPDPPAVRAPLDADRSSRGGAMSVAAGSLAGELVGHASRAATARVVPGAPRSIDQVVYALFAMLIAALLGSRSPGRPASTITTPTGGRSVPASEPDDDGPTGP